MTMNRAEVTAQLEHMKQYYERSLADELAKLVPGTDDRNLSVLTRVKYCKEWLDLITVAAGYIDQVTEPASPPPPAPAKTPPKLVGGRFGWPRPPKVEKPTVR